MRYPEQLIVCGEGVALESAKLSLAELLSGLSHSLPSLYRRAYRLWETKRTPRMRCRMRYWQLTGT